MSLFQVLAFSNQSPSPELKKRSKNGELHQQISVTLQTGLSDTRDFFAFDHSTQANKQAEESLSSFLSIEGSSANTFFLIGFLLIKQAFTKDFNQAQDQLKTILASFDSLQECTNSILIKNDLLTLQNKLEDFFDKSLAQSKGKNFDRSSDIAVAQFLCFQCHTDEELVNGITQAGRGMIINALELETAPAKKILLSKISAEKEWTLENDNLEELFHVFASAFDYYVVLNYTKKFEKICIGEEDARNTALLLSYHSKVSGVSRVLYKVIDQENTQSSTLTVLDNQPLSAKKHRKISVHKICDMCYKALSNETILMGRPCGHNFCLRCLKGCKQLNSSQCILKKCSTRANMTVIKEINDKLTIQPSKAVAASMSNLSNLNMISVKPRMSLQIAESDLNTCSLCMQKNLAMVVYTNEECRHKYCIYCIEDTGLLDSSHCVSKKCSSPIDETKLEEFYNKNCEGKTFRESQNHIPDEGCTDVGIIRCFSQKKDMLISKRYPVKKGEEPTQELEDKYKVKIKLC